MYWLIFALLIVAVQISQPSRPRAAELEPEPVYSRQDLYFVIRELDQGDVEFSLPAKFDFPDSVRPTSTFGIDVSNNNERACACEINWTKIVEQKVRFVYLKATEGATYTDRTFLRSYPILRDLQSQGRVNVGAYHFLTSKADIEKQIQHFLQVYRSSSSQDLPPSLDLEWNLGPWSSECPSNASVKIRQNAGVIVKKCDLWHQKTGDEILDEANAWIDAVKTSTRRTPVVYTNAQWWASRIGDPKRIETLHTPLIWIADYSKGGLATEQPRVPAEHEWKLWQFSEISIVNDGAYDLIVDASIYEKDPASLAKDLTVAP